MADHVLGHGCLRKLDAEFEQFPVDTWRSPPRVGETHPSDEIADFRRHGWASFTMATLPSPEEPEPHALPSNDGLRLNNKECRSPTCPQL
jgi:hypothetical protein